MLCPFLLTDHGNADGPTRLFSGTLRKSAFQSVDFSDGRAIIPGLINTGSDNFHYERVHRKYLGIDTLIKLSGEATLSNNFATLLK